jgi:hypothetical protein
MTSSGHRLTVVLTEPLAWWAADEAVELTGKDALLAEFGAHLSGLQL